MSMLEKAILIAARAHMGQKDRAGAPYILHPLRMMLSVDTETERTVAVLHDVVEDSDWTLEDLRREGFPDDVVSAVDALTRREGEPYEDLVERARVHPLARRIKLADLEDNMDTRRMSELSAKEIERLKKYHRAWLAISD